MKIKKLHIVNSSRFNLSANEIIYSPTDKIEVIIGSNGAGKSSLMRYLFPIALDSKDFKDGYRELTIEHNNSIYVLSNYKLGSNKHSFIKDNEELNTGYTKTIFNNLVKAEFNLDNEIMNLLLGIKRFTISTPNDRKNWFSRMSTVDYTYALKLYKKIESKARDLIGGIKLLDKKILELEVAIQEDITPLEVFLKYLEDKQRDLYNLTTNIEITDNLSIIKALTNRVEVLGNSILQYSDITLDKDIVLIELSKLKRDEDILLEKIDKALEFKNTSIDELQREYNELSNRPKIQESFLFVPLEDANTILNNLKREQDNIDTLIRNCIELHEVSTIDASIEEHNKLQLESNITRLKEKRNRILGEIKVLREAKEQDDVKCPRCNTKFKPNFDTIRLSNLEKSIIELESKLEHYTKLLEDVNTKLGKIKELDQYTSMLGRVLESVFYSKYKEIFRGVGDETLKNKIIEIRGILELEVTEYRNIIRLKELERVLERFSDIGITSDMDKDLIALKSKIEHYQNILSRIEKRDKISNELNTSLKDLKRELDNTSIVKTNLTTGLISKHIKPVIEYLDTEIKEYRSKISKYHYAKESLKRLIEEKSELLLELENLNKVKNGLSPKSGLIAESITHFIGYVISKMNEIISRIWEYPLKVLPTEIGEEDLTFKFKVEQGGNIIPDVMYCSDGQKEIIDVAFLIIFMELNGMRTYPLFLDEFGKRFDKVHRDKTTELIKSFSTHRQIFLITHFNSMINNSTDYNINVLHSGNINLQHSSINKHLILK